MGSDPLVFGTQTVLKRVQALAFEAQLLTVSFHMAFTGETVPVLVTPVAVFLWDVALVRLSRPRQLWVNRSFDNKIVQAWL